MPLFGPPNIESMESKRDITGLIKSLDYDKDKEICRKAARALAHFTSDPRVVEALINALPHEFMRSELLEILGNSKDRRAFEPLKAALNSEWCPNAAKALGKLGDVRACPELKKIADHGGTNERRAAINALTDLGDPYVVDLILRELKSAPFDTKADLVQKLSRFNDPRIVNVLLDLSLETGVSGLYRDLEKRINIDLNRGIFYEA